MSVKISSLNTASTIDSGDDINIAGNNPLTFSDWGGGWFMQDGTYIRSLNQKSIWLGDGVLASQGGLSVGYGGALPTAGYAIIAGSVGIGTSNPLHKLEVAGNISINGGSYLDFANGDVRFVNSSGLLSVQTYSLATGLTTKMVVTGSGNVGIGTTTPIYRFEVSDGTRTGIINPNASLDGIFLGVKEAKPLVFGTTDTERMRITSGGALLIGTTSTTNTAAGKIVNRLGGTSNPDLVLNGGAWSIASIGGEPALYLSSNIVAATGIPGATQTAKGGMGFEYSSATSPTDLVLGIFGTPTVASSVKFFNNTERMRITSAGNVGIGTTSPLGKLQVSAGRSYFFSGDYYSIGLAQTAAQGNYMFLGTAADGTFYISETGGTARVTVQQGGNVGIGTTSPTAPLDINGAVRVRGNNQVYFDTTGDSASNYIGITNDYWTTIFCGRGNNSRIDLTNGSGILFSESGAERMRITSGGNVLIGTTTDAGYKLYVNGGGLFNGVVTSYATMDHYARRINSPEGASYVTTTSSVTGAIKIKLPVARNNSSTMMMFRVKIYQYNTGNCHEFQIAGYNYVSGNWYNPSVTDLTDNGSNFNVRFGTDATSDCIWIGETNSGWVYPQVFVTDFQAGYGGNGISWATGWAISFETSFDTVEETRLASQVITSRSIGAQSVNYAVSAGTAGALSSMNISQFTNDSGYITSSALGAYLPLAGGTMSGNITYSPGDATNWYIRGAANGAVLRLRYSGGTTNRSGALAWVDNANNYSDVLTWVDDNLNATVPITSNSTISTSSNIISTGGYVQGGGIILQNNYIQATVASGGFWNSNHDVRFYPSAGNIWNITGNAFGLSSFGLNFLDKYGVGNTLKAQIFWSTSELGLKNDTNWVIKANQGGSYGGTLYGAWIVTGSITASANSVISGAVNSAYGLSVTNTGTTNAAGLYVNLGASATGVPFRVDKNGSALFDLTNAGNATIKGALTISGSNLYINSSAADISSRYNNGSKIVGWNLATDNQFRLFDYTNELIIFGFNATSQNLDIYSNTVTINRFTSSTATLIFNASTAGNIWKIEKSDANGLSIQKGGVQQFGINAAGQASFIGSLAVVGDYLSVGAYGLYSSTYTAFFRRNDVSSYGAWELVGAKGSYTGMFYNAPNRPHMMFNTTDGSGGLYYETLSRWILYYNYTNNCLAVGGTTTNATYKMYVTGAIYATGAIVANSDGRNKENVEVVENALEKVTNLRGVTYTKKDQDSGKREMGVIAQEVEPHVPEVVHHSKDADVYGVSYGNFAGLFIEAIKEQQVLINELKAEIEILKNK